MPRVHDVQKLSFEDGRLHLQVDGSEYTFDLADISPSLLRASPEERTRYEISPSGYGIHWPLIDEDLSIDGLLGVKHYPPEIEARSPTFPADEWLRDSQAKAVGAYSANSSPRTVKVVCCVLVSIGPRRLTSLVLSTVRNWSSTICPVLPWNRHGTRVG